MAGLQRLESLGFLRGMASGDHRVSVVLGGSGRRIGPRLIRASLCEIGGSQFTTRCCGQCWFSLHEYPMPTNVLADSGRRGAQRSGIKAEPAGRGTAAELSAASA